MRTSRALGLTLLATALLLLAPTSTFALDGTFVRTFGGGYGHSVYETPDGGAVLAGTYGALTDCCQPWLIKLGADGAVQWQRTYVAAGLGGARNIVPTRDGGYLMAGDGAEFLVLKLDVKGRVQWAKNYGDGGYAYEHVLEASDGNFLVTGQTFLGDGLAPDGRAMLLDPEGNILWQKVYGRPLLIDSFANAVEGYNGNFIVVGSSVGDYWVLELDHATGAVVWQNVYGGPFEDTGLVITKILSDRYLVVGASDTFSAGGLRNWWAVILSSTGKVQKEFSLGGFDAEDPHAATATSDGGFMIGGGSASFGPLRGDTWLVKFDSKAEIQWQKRYGFEERSDNAWQIQETRDGYTVIGDSYQYPIEYELFLMNIDKDGNVDPGSCGATADTDAIPFQTNAPGRVSVAKNKDTVEKAVDFEVVDNSQPFPIEACFSE